ncbi:MAG: type 1 fimbrial protein [Rhodanobacter sp.]|nr:MAG: type 1 fimbrial protein [Rhodanobacter sp.]TAM13965.1 MAG: type 1 fimbrial protein [Rhodanobacter sp.]TAM36602.1 MAG: type 1 fimbrial protein [Rhodanobacter sp.]
MSKSLLSAALVAALGTFAFIPSAQAATAIDGTITINGQVVAATCTVAVNGTSGGNGTVVLKPAPTSALAAAAATYGDMPFTIAVTGCDSSLNGKTVTPYWSGTNVNGSGRLNSTGTANNVNLQLLNSDDSTAIALNGAEGNQGTSSATVASQAATMTYYARYYATGAATAGTVSSTVDYTLIYQ